MCDHLIEACSDAAKFMNIPYIVTAAFDMSPGKKIHHLIIKFVLPFSLTLGNLTRQRCSLYQHQFCCHGRCYY